MARRYDSLVHYRFDRHKSTSHVRTPLPTASSAAGQEFQWPRKGTNAAESISTDPSVRASHETDDTPGTSVRSSPSDHASQHDVDMWFEDFRSDLDISDECPDRAQLAAVAEIPVYDSEGQARPFRSLYDPTTSSHQRQLIIFIRHFFCGACQAYLKRLTEQLTEQVYFSIPVPTNIAIIGCGKPHMIDYYRKLAGNCPWPIYAEPTRKLYRKLGMSVTVDMGSVPEYMNGEGTVSWLWGQVVTIKDSVQDPDGLRKRDAVKGGNILQLGGEFIFEDGDVIWCHRMKNMRNHAELSVLKKMLDIAELDPEHAIVGAREDSMSWNAPCVART